MRFRTEITPRLEEHIKLLLPDESPALRSVARDNTYIESGGMQVPREQGSLLAFLVRTLQARLTLEVGVFTGYSLIATAEALPDDGKIVGIEIDEGWATLARHNAADAGVSGKVEVIVGDAVTELKRLHERFEPGQVDLVFIDADKAQYRAYFEQIFDLVRPGGVIAFDNVFWAGEVASESPDEETRQLQTLTVELARDPRFTSTLLTMCDGVLLLHKR